MNPYTPYDLIEASEQALADWRKLPFEEKVAFFKKIGLLDENGDVHSDYTWTPERYAKEYGPWPDIKPASSAG